MSTLYTLYILYMCLYNRQWSDTKQRRKLSFNGQEHFFAVSQILEKDDNDLKLPEMLPIMQPSPPQVSEVTRLTSLHVLLMHYVPCLLHFIFTACC